MNAKQIIERYKAGERDFRRLNLRGMNFREANLSGADFSECDLRGTNFRYAKLNEVNFTKIIGGLQKRKSLFLLILSLIASVLAGLFNYFSAYCISLTFAPQRWGNPREGFIIGIIGLVAYPILILFVWRKGIVGSLGAVAGAVALVFAAAVVLIVVGKEAISVSGPATLIVTVILAEAVTSIGAAIGAGAVAVAGTCAIIIIVIAVFIFAVVFAIAEIVAIAVAIAVFWAYIGWRAWQGDLRDAWVRSFAVAYGAIGGTCFRGANLTDADFTGATLKSSDFREATLVRTIWKDAIKLDQVRFGTSYLGIKKIRELLRSGKADSEDKNYNRLVNLQGLNLAGFNLTGTNFSGSDLSDSNLQGTNLTDANLIITNLNDANLKDADLSRAKLVQTQLDNTDLTGTTLTGACIEDWGITVYTILNGIHCDYVYMRFIDGDKRRRKPDGEDTNFAEGEFVEFIKPLIDTLDLYHRQVEDPKIISLAIAQLQHDNPDLNFETVSIEKRGKDNQDILVRLQVLNDVNFSDLHRNYFAIYDALKALPYSEVSELFQKFIYHFQTQEKEIARLEGKLENNIIIMSDQSISIGGDAGIVGGGDVKDINFQGTMNLGQISGNVTNAINQLPDRPADDQPNIKELLSQLQAAIAAETELSETDKVDALEQIRIFATAAQNPTDTDNQKLAKTASRILKGILAELPTFTAIAKQAKEYLPVILTFFGL